MSYEESINQPSASPSEIRLPENLSDDTKSRLASKLKEYENQLTLRGSTKKIDYKVRILEVLLGSGSIDLTDSVARPAPEGERAFGENNVGQEMLYAEAATEVRADVNEILSK